MRVCLERQRCFGQGCAAAWQLGQAKACRWRAAGLAEARQAGARAGPLPLRGRPSRRRRAAASGAAPAEQLAHGGAAAGGGRAGAAQVVRLRQQRAHLRQLAAARGGRLAGARRALLRVRRRVSAGAAARLHIGQLHCGASILWVWAGVRSVRSSSSSRPAGKAARASPAHLGGPAVVEGDQVLQLALHAGHLARQRRLLALRSHHAVLELGHRRAGRGSRRGRGQRLRQGGARARASAGQPGGRALQGGSPAGRREGPRASPGLQAAQRVRTCSGAGVPLASAGGAGTRPPSCTLDCGDSSSCLEARLPSESGSWSELVRLRRRRCSGLMAAEGGGWLCGSSGSTRPTLPLAGVPPCCGCSASLGVGCCCWALPGPKENGPALLAGPAAAAGVPCGEGSAGLWPCCCSLARRSRASCAAAWNLFSSSCSAGSLLASACSCARLARRSSAFRRAGRSSRV